MGEDNFLFIPCQSIRDDADLFGSRLGGSRGGEYSSDGQLTSFLRSRQGKKCIIFLDEFEKIKDLTSSLGWGQDKKIFQASSTTSNTAEANVEAHLVVHQMSLWLTFFSCIILAVVFGTLAGWYALRSRRHVRW